MANLKTIYEKPAGFLDDLGNQLSFYIRALAWTPRTIHRYKKEIMRISEEVDALEVMAIPSLPFLVTTRIIGGLIAIIPLYVVGLLSSYFATRLTVTQFCGQSTGTYDYSFNQFLPPGDVLWSFGKVMVFAVVVILIHCYHGYNASGGPAGVGVAVGRAVRTSIVAINVIDLLLSMAIWGTTTTVRLAG